MRSRRATFRGLSRPERIGRGLHPLQHLERLEPPLGTGMARRLSGGGRYFAEARLLADLITLLPAPPEAVRW
jgi:hypothetical protein